MLVPEIPAGNSGRFALVDWRTEDVSGAAPAGTAGTIQATGDKVPDDEWWLVERLIVQCTSTTDTNLDLYIGGVAPQYERDWTPQGGSTANKGVAEYPRGMLIEPSTELIIVWSGASSGATARYNAQIQVYKRTGG